MHSKTMGWDDTIVALATPPGIGAIGVIRLSGPQTFEIVNRLFPSKDLLKQASHTIHVGFIQANGRAIDEVVVSLYRGPRSYTGEDVIEISCHGSPYVQQQVIESCIEEGARLAKPGEFTQRAFLNGKLDLAQAEAVADLIASSTKASRDTALHAMRGGFSRVLSELREQMIRFSALIELELDFSQEDVEFADRSQFYALLRQAVEVTGRLLESFKYGNVIRNGVRVAIVGKPNAGKSTLLNNLLNENRAIVSEIAGTTRDTIEEVLNIEGILFRLIDTAGLREETGDVIEKAGMEKTVEKIREADLVVYVFDVNEMEAEELERIVGGYEGEGRKVLLVGNKIDVNGEGYAKGRFGGAVDGGGYAKNEAEAAGSSREQPETDKLAGPDFTDGYAKNEIAGTGFDGDKHAKDTVSSTGFTGAQFSKGKLSSSPVDGVLFLSARDDKHLDTLKRRMFALVMEGGVGADETVVTNARHYDALRNVYASLQEILRELDAGLPGDLLSLDIRRTLHWLGEITGEITNEDQLDYIFSKFCIGK